MPPPVGGLHPEVDDQRGIRVCQPEANTNPGDASPLLHVGDAGVPAGQGGDRQPRPKTLLPNKGPAWRVDFPLCWKTRTGAPPPPRPPPHPPEPPPPPPGPFPP